MRVGGEQLSGSVHKPRLGLGDLVPLCIPSQSLYTLSKYIAFRIHSLSSVLLRMQCILYARVLVSANIILGSTRVIGYINLSSSSEMIANSVHTAFLRAH